ncbi:MAG: hypothetical protein AABY22_15530, partial [Nanoarchaeota archaeon]
MKPFTNIRKLTEEEIKELQALIEKEDRIKMSKLPISQGVKTLRGNIMDLPEKTKEEKENDIKALEDLKIKFGR